MLCRNGEEYKSEHNHVRIIGERGPIVDWIEG